MTQPYDCVIVGGGPAGLSAAVYMARFLRRTLVLDDHDGRSTFSQVNDNYLGFPGGLPIRELRRLGREQAQRFGAEFRSGTVDSLQRRGGDFLIRFGNEEVVSRTAILCTGVEDIWPDLPNARDFVGKSLFWCITCDGFRTYGKRIVLFGRDDEAATTACQFKLYTDEITFIAPPGGIDCSKERVRALEEHGIDLLEGEVACVTGTPERPEAILLKDGRTMNCDLIFSLLGCRPNVELARQVGASLTSKGYVRIDHDGYTTVPGLFCAGDVSGIHTHQVASAVHEGAEAAQTANYYLYAGYQKHELRDVRPRLELT